MRNSGIVIERVSIEEGSKSNENGIAAAAVDLTNKEEETSEKLCEEQYVEIEHIEAVSSSFSPGNLNAACLASLCCVVVPLNIRIWVCLNFSLVIFTQC